MSYESKAFSRGRCTVAATGECSLGRVLFNILRQLRGVSLVQHDVSMMRANLLAGIAVLLLSAGTAHAAERAAHAAVMITNTESW